MKVTDWNEIRTAAAKELNDNGSEILEYLNIDEAADCLSMIYLTNDRMAGFAQDYLGNLSVISSPTRIAIIFLGHHSYYKHDVNICEYEDIEDDMREINMVLNAALLRWNDQFA